MAKLSAIVMRALHPETPTEEARTAAFIALRMAYEQGRLRLDDEEERQRPLPDPPRPRAPEPRDEQGWARNWGPSPGEDQGAWSIAQAAANSILAVWPYPTDRPRKYAPPSPEGLALLVFQVAKDEGVFASDILEAAQAYSRWVKSKENFDWDRIYRIENFVRTWWVNWT